MAELGIETGGEPLSHFLRLAIIQAVAYVLLIGSGVFQAVVSGNGQFGAAAMLTVLMMFLIFWPFRGGIADRATSAGFGVLSLAFAVTALGDMSFYPKPTAEQVAGGGLEAVVFPYARWASMFVALLVLLTVLGFARQMFRKRASHLVRALSHSLTSGVACASLAGWSFLPHLLDQLGGKTVDGPRLAGVIAVLVLAVALIVALSLGSLLWWAQSDPDERIPAPWIGFALLPVLLSGLVVYGAGLGVLLVLLAG